MGNLFGKDNLLGYFDDPVKQNSIYNSLFNTPLDHNYYNNYSYQPRSNHKQPMRNQKIEHLLLSNIENTINSQLNASLFPFQKQMIEYIKLMNRHYTTDPIAVKRAVTRATAPAKKETTQQDLPTTQPSAKVDSSSEQPPSTPERLEKTPLEAPVTPFVLKPTASRRTRQRWAAHQAGTCNRNCRFCRKLASPTYGSNDTDVRLTEDKSRVIKTVIEPQPVTAATVLADVVSDNHEAAAKRVARNVAAVEINQAALTPGMVVYHQFTHAACILLEETAPGLWTVQTKAGDREKEVKAAILTPIPPVLPVRMWLATKTAVSSIFYKEMEVSTPTGLVTVQEPRIKLAAQALLSLVSVLFVAAFYNRVEEKDEQGRMKTVYKRGKLKHLFWATLVFGLTSYVLLTTVR